MHRASGSLLNLLKKEHPSLSSVISSGRYGFVASSVRLQQNGHRESCMVQKRSSSHDSKRGYAAKAAQEPFLNGSSSVYVEEMYRAWQQDPNSVHKVCIITITCGYVTFSC